MSAVDEPEIGRVGEAEAPRAAGQDRPFDLAPERPWPPRYWWLKRLSVAGAVLLVALGGVRWWWGAEAERRLAARIAELRARGEPVTLEDFQQFERDIPDEENAAHFYMRAAEAIPGYTPDPNPKAQLENYAEVLRQVREGRERTEVDWGVRLSRPIQGLLPIPYMSAQRNLARVLDHIAATQHDMGDDAAAVETLLDFAAQVRAVGEGSFAIIGHISHITLEEELLAARIERFVPKIRVASEMPSNTAEDGIAAPRERFEALIASFVEEEWLFNVGVRAYRQERVWALEILEANAPSAGGFYLLGAATELAFTPQYWLYVLESLETLDCGVAGLLAENLYAARIKLDRFDEPQTGFRAYLHPFGVQRTFSIDRLLFPFYRMLATRRMAAVALAIRLYEIDHGERPMVLEELVPGYLPAVPLDPFAPSERPIQYRREGPHPRLYCVGPDGVDDGGRFVSNPWRVNWTGVDWVFFLDGDGPRRAGIDDPPATDEDEMQNEE